MHRARANNSKTIKTLPFDLDEISFPVFFCVGFDLGFRNMLKIFVLLAFISVSNCNYYELLGITKDADDRQIRLAFKKLVVALHPDKNKVSFEIILFHVS